jgi:NHLM bacteriocin system ABC transporter ATP-binding protein
MKGQGISVARRLFFLRIIAANEYARVGEEIRVGDGVDIGRDVSCALVLHDESVSRRHARVEQGADGLHIVDLGSGNGIWIGTERVKDVVLRPGQRCSIGSTVFECCEEVPVMAAAAATAATMLVNRSAIDLSELSRPDEPVTPAVGFAVRVVVGGEIVMRGQEFIVDGSEVTIGRGGDCGIILDERDVSRKSAKFEVVPEGFLVTDLGGSVGVWRDNQKVISEVVPPGTHIRLGPRIVVALDLIGAEAAQSPAPPPVVDADATQYIQQADAEAIRANAAAPPPPVVAPPAVAPAPADVPAAAAIPVPPPSAPPPPAATHAAGTAAVISDAPVPPPVIVSAPPAESGVTDADFGQTVMIPVGAMPLPTVTEAAAAAPTARRLEDVGEVIPVSAHDPFLANDTDSVWIVVTGGILLFTVALENGQPVGTRSHFLGINTGQCFFGIDALSVGSGFLAVAKQGTTVRKLKRAELQEVAADPAQAPAIAALVDTWVLGLSKALIHGLPVNRWGDKPLVPGERLEISAPFHATSSGGVVWIDIWSGSILFDDMATPTFDRRHALFPMTPDSWIMPLTDEFGPLALTPVRTAESFGDDSIWYALTVFHGLLCECEFISKKLATVDEYVRLQQKKEARDAAGEMAQSAIASVMRTEAGSPAEHMASASAEPVFRACALVGASLGIKVYEHPNADEARTYEDQVLAIASASGFRTRTVALRGEWYNEDHGSLLGQRAESSDPVALLQNKPQQYELVDPKTGERHRVTSKDVDGLSVFAYTFYRTFPDGTLSVKDIIKFGFVGMGSDVRWVLLMAMIVGMCGTVTPYFTGKIFDEAVPQADRSSLIVYGLAMLGFAFAMAAFKFVQGVATLRISTRMGSSIQSALWDRIMVLPVNFFRQYSAGDLADRADGVEEIQALISGAGVSAILGSISGLFYVGQMFGYDLTLALVAVGLTVTFVTVNMTCNYLQLRYQRQEMTIRGSITGLVLNLLTGVSKLRICGSELHAFRVWAMKFATQRKISFTIGKIQNAAETFGTLFPILSNLLIFYVMISAQSKGGPQGPTLTTGDFIAFTSAYGLFMSAMQSLGDASLSMLRIVPVYERFKPILDCKPEVDRSKAFPGQLTGAIEISHCKFRYTPDGPWIVNDLTLSVKPGQFVAFVGGSGCGKSTLMRLMLGFEVPSSGSISFDGQDISQLDLRMVRQQMGVVMQKSQLMPTEIYRNIIGVGSKTIQDAWWAAERAGLSEDIKAMPMGMHTYVSEGGGTLSGGQRQRLMIARAIVNKPKILFLDEATSALDNRSQAIVTESMDKMEATRIVIAHRLSTIINADKICYMEGGKIIEMGNYDELMKLDGLFAALAKRQVA